MKKIAAFFSVLTLYFLIALLAVTYLKDQKILVIKGGTLIDGTGKSPVENSIIIIEQKKIKAVSQTGKIHPPLFARTIDARGKFIIPGLVDMHVHFLNESFSDLFLLNGVTTTRDMGNNIDFIINLRDKINQGILQGPSIFASGYLINNRKIPFGASQYTAVVKNPKEARKIVALLARRKVDWIKIYMTLPRNLVRIIIKEAKKYKIPVAGHLRRVDAELAARWGIKTLEHTTGVSEALLGEENFEDAPPLWTISNKTWLHVDRTKHEGLIDLFLKKNVYITANLTLYQGLCSTPDELKKNPHIKLMPEIFQNGWKNYLSLRFLELTKDRESWKITKKKIEEFLILFKEKGGKVLTGTDTTWPYLVPGFSLHKELELLVEAGFSPMEALLAATKYPAEALNQEKNLGTLEEGKIANLILLNANPLDDIRQTQNIDIVVKDGIVIQRERLYSSLLKHQKSSQ